jgi:hypothetical protein
MDMCWPLQMQPTAKSVLMSLADNANDQGYCWPSIANICKRTCFSKRAVIDAIAWLELNGALSANRSNGRHTTYVVTPLSYVEPVQQAHQCNKRTGASNASEPVQQAHQPVHLPHQPVREMHTNPQEPSLTINESNHHLFGDVYTRPLDDRFDEFWEAYPVKTGKKQSRDKWKAMGLVRFADEILADVAAKQAQDRRWVDGYRPNPLTYLNQERWNDPVQLKKAAPGKPPIAQHFANKTYTGTPDDELPEFLRTGTH